MKKSIITALSILLTFLVLTQTMSIAVFAIDDESEKITDETAETVESVNNLADMPDIVCEVESKRDACKKDFLLEDGSYCSVISATPFEMNITGNLTGDRENNCKSIFDELDYMDKEQKSNDELLSNNRGLNPIDIQDSSMCVNIADGIITPSNATWQNGKINFGEFCGIWVKPNIVGDYSQNNKLIVSAGFSAYCYPDTVNSPIIYLYEEDRQWDSVNPPEDAEDIEYIEDLRLDSSLVVNNQGRFTWDVTDLFIRWDRNSTDNNGFFMYNTIGNSFSVENLYFVVRYIEVETEDIDFTYHCVDMSKAGNVFINDATNTIRCEQDLIGITNDLTEAMVSRTYNSCDSTLFNSAGIKSRFNYESEIKIDSSLAEWIMVGGTGIRFLRPTTPTYIGNYEIWPVDENTGIENTDAELMVDMSNYNGTSFDYSNAYVIMNGLKYLFNSSGKLSSIIDNSTSSSILVLTYKLNGNIEKIIRSDGLTFGFTYSIPQGFTCGELIQKIELVDSNNQVITNANNEMLRLTFSYSLDANNNIINSVNYYNNYSVVYTYKSSGQLLSVVNEKDCEYRFNYNVFSSGVTSNILASYEKQESQSISADEIVQINDDNAFQREYLYSDGTNELFHYDRNYQLTTYKDKTDMYKCIEYDSEGIVNSYIFEMGENQYITGNGFEIGGFSFGDWQKSSANVKKVTTEYHLGSRSVQFGKIKELTSDSLRQIISSNTPLQEDKTYILGGWVKAKDTNPNNGLVRIVIYTIPVNAQINGSLTVSSNLWDENVSLEYDCTTNNVWQYLMTSFKLTEESYVMISLEYINQINYVYFDDITLFESQDAVTDLEDMVTSLPIEYTYGSNGQIASESLTWDRATETDLTMSTAYSYTQNVKLREYEDFNGNPTYYQYDSNGILSGKGHSVDGLGNITDVNTLVYDAESVLTNTTQIIQNIENNNNVTLSTGYDEYKVSSNDSDITYVKIHHNGYDQVFKYDSEDGGMITETYAESTALPNDRTNYNTVYQYDNNREIVQIDYSNGFRDRYYEEDYNDEYTYKCISRYAVNGQTETLIKTYVYQFDDEGKLLKSYDDSTNIMIDYTNNGYSLYEYDDPDPLLIFSNETFNGNNIQTFSNTGYSLPESGINPLYTSPDTIETTSSVISTDNEGIKTSSSSVSVEKNLANYIMTADYDRMSVTDYFGRLNEKEVTLDHEYRNDVSGSLTSNIIYEYKDLGSGRTSGLVSGYTSTITGSYLFEDEKYPGVPSVTNINNSYSRKYEYDNRGNVKFVYTEENNTIVPKEYYEYDNANQIITEINFENQISAHYTYDAGGNLTAKIYYDYEDLVFNISNREITTLGNEVDRITYQYDSVWKDRLVSYDGNTITYDKMGNPLNYIGTNNEGVEVTGTLEWQGNYLTAFQSDALRIEYQYDMNGYRISQLVKEKKIVNNTPVFRDSYAIKYLWDNGVLNGLIYTCFINMTPIQEYSYSVMIIYDETGSPIGHISNTGIPFLFKKDIYDSIVSLVFPDGDDLLTYHYDSWGNAIASYSSEWTYDPIAYAVARLIASLSPLAYHGYLYDYETGMCFNKGRCYSPDWGRNLNPEDYEKLLDRPENPLEANLYLFCDNNPLNVLDKTASWYKEYRGVEWKSNGFEVKMSDIFASRPICTLFASQIVKVHGSWDVGIGYNYLEMSIDDIASDLFAHYVGKYAKASINKVNAVWGDGWILKNSKSDTIFVYKDDPNLSKPGKKGKYYKIWIAAPEIKAYAQKEGIFITL